MIDINRWQQSDTQDTLNKDSVLSMKKVVIWGADGRCCPGAGRPQSFWRTLGNGNGVQWELGISAPNADMVRGRGRERG
jgi:hypothetical protein